MNASVNVRLYKSKTYSDGSHPVILQYIIDGKVKKKVLTKCLPSDWDAKTLRLKSKCRNAARINHFISSEYAKAESNLYDLKSGDKELSDVFNAKKKLSLNEAFEAELTRFKTEHKSGAYDKILAIRAQIKDTSIPISNIDPSWLKKQISVWIGSGNNGATIRKKLKLLRGMIGRYSEKGIAEELRAVTVPAQKAVKQKLTADELSRLENLLLPDGEMVTVVRDMFLMQIYLRGIRIGDLLQAHSEDFKEGRYSYRADKTGKQMNIRLIPKAQVIFERYQNKHERLFPFFRWKPNNKLSDFENERGRLKHKESCTSSVNRYLKIIAAMAGITKPLSSHIARHTFARMAIDKINNPMVTMELLGHSSLAVHQSYLSDIRKDDELDKAADDIFG